MNDANMNKAMEDLQTIKAAMAKGDRWFPGRAWMLLFGAGIILVASSLNYFVPVFLNDFAFTFWVLWVPAVGLMGLVLATAWIVLRRRDKITVSWSAREIGYLRFVFGPVVVTLIYLLWAAGYFMPPVILLCAAIPTAGATLISPKPVRVFPVVFMLTGLTELIVGWTDPVLVLINGIVASVCVAATGLIVRRGETGSRNHG